MKKTVLLFLGLLMFQTSEAIAQVKFGIKAGVNINNVSISDGLDYSVSNNVGFSFGPTARLSLPVKGLAVEASAMFDQQSIGVESPNLMGGRIYETTLRQQQIVVPINLHYGFEISEKTVLSIFAGPQVGFRVGKKEVATDYAEWLAKSAVFSINTGLALTISEHIQLSAAYNIVCGKSGEFWINRQTKGGGESIGNAKFNSVKLAVAYYF